MRWHGGRLLAVALLVSAEAGAVVTQPGSAVSLPRPVGAAEWMLVTSGWAYNTQTQVNYDFTGIDVNQQNLHYGDFYPTFEDGDAITLQGLFKWQGEAIDPTLDAIATSGAFVPHCALSAELLLVGGSCQPVLYWYNTQTLSGGPPNPQELYPLIPAAGSTVTADLQCQPPLDEGFCPLAWDNRMPRDLSKLAWSGDPVVVDLSSDLNYRGGAIGFAIGSTESTRCSRANYSFQEHNVRDALERPFIAALMYQSGVEPEAVYVAFEEGAMLPGDWTNGGATDGDFNDYVIRVSGCFEEPNGAGGTGGEGAGGDSGEGGTYEGGQSGASGAAPSGEGGAAVSGRPSTEGGALAVEAGGAPASSEPTGAGAAPSPVGGGGDDASSATASTSAGDGGCGCRWPAKRTPNAAILLSILALAALRARKR